MTDFLSALSGPDVLRVSWLVGVCCGVVVLGDGREQLREPTMSGRDGIADRRAKVLAMSMDGDSAASIAAALGVHRRTVERDRTAMAIVVPEKPCRGGRYSRGCRCDLCRAKNTESQRRWKIRRKDSPIDFEHGYSGYANHDCRCEVCAAEHRERMQIYYRRRVERQKATEKSS